MVSSMFSMLLALEVIEIVPQLPTHVPKRAWKYTRGECVQVDFQIMQQGAITYQARAADKGLE
jgi:hypothetical protein